MGKTVSLDIAEAANTVRSRLRPVHWSTLSINKSCDYFIKGLIEPEQHLLIYGASGSGKTFLAMAMAFAVASGQGRFFGMKVRKANVLYIGSEGGASSLAKRAAAIQEELGIRPGDCNLHFLAVAPNFGFQNSEDARMILEHIKEIFGGQPCVIWNDTLAKSMHGQSEDKSEGMGCYISNARSFTEAGHAFVSIHHTGKDADRGSRGSYSLPADVDGMLSVEKVGGVSVVHVHKSRDGEDGSEYAFDLEQVELGRDDDGDAITTCIVREVDQVPKKATRLSPKQRLGLSALQECLADQGRSAPNGDRYPANAQVIHTDEWRALCKLRGVFGESNPSTDWSRLRRDLLSKGVTAEYNELVWQV